MTPIARLLQSILPRVFALALVATLPATAFAAAPGSVTIPFNQGWLFGGKSTPAARDGDAAFDDKKFEQVTLPHSVVKLSWQNWDYHLWQDVWIYRKHFTLPEAMRGMRVFIHFDGVMTGLTPVINGHALEKRLGGYLPARYELTKYLAEAGGENVLAVEVDGRWSNVPPQGSPKGPEQVDYFLPAGIHRQVSLVAVPQVYIKDVFAKPANVLDAATRRVEVACALDAGGEGQGRRGKITAELRDGSRVIARAEKQIALPPATGAAAPIQNRESKIENSLTLSGSGLRDISLWSPDTPKLYEVVTTLAMDGQPAPTVATRIGFREAKFTTDGFFLNGKRLQIFGLNRHELFPYTGYAMPPRVMRRDAEILKRDLNLNFVRCSHYPQTEAFLDACDELGLMVWQEVPGWQYVGDDKPWHDLLVRDTRDMVIRDRNHPSIVIWGTRVNESGVQVELYRRTRAAARELDDTRPLSGSIHPPTRKNWEKTWEEEVFAYDDYHADGPASVGILPPIKGHPYMLAEAVGGFNYRQQKNFNNKYRRAGDIQLQTDQALFHAQAHNKAAANPRNSGVVAWLSFDYNSLVNGYNTVKCPGVVDGFRIPKLGATFYQAQVDANVKPVIAPNFYWDFGAATPHGPGKHAAIFSNCDRLEIFINDKPHATLKPDVKNFPNLKHAPFFVDLDLDGAGKPELRIDGYVADKLVLTRKFSSDPTKDKLTLTADDTELIADGSDATRLEIRVTDAHGAARAYAHGIVDFKVTGPGELIGDAPFSLTETGGAAALWLRAKPGASGPITVTATDRRLGAQTLTVNVKKQE